MHHKISLSFSGSTDQSMQKNSSCHHKISGHKIVVSVYFHHTHNILAYYFHYSSWKFLYLSSMFILHINPDSDYRNINMASIRPVTCFKFVLVTVYLLQHHCASLSLSLSLSLSPMFFHIPCCLLQYLAYPNPLFTDYVENKLEISKLHKWNKLSTLNGSTTNQVQHGWDQTMALPGYSKEWNCATYRHT